jgi:hypothetical protein
MDPKAVRCTFIGWDMTTKGYHYYNPLTKKIFFTQHVMIDESEIPTTRATTGKSPSTFNFQWNVCSFLLFLLIQFP